MEFNNSHKDNRFDIPESENVDLNTSSVTAQDMEEALEKLRRESADTDIFDTQILQEALAKPIESATLQPESQAPLDEYVDVVLEPQPPRHQDVRNDQEIGRLIKEVRELKDSAGSPPPPRNVEKREGNGGGDGGRRIVQATADSPVNRIVFETNKKFKECEKCGGSGKRFFLFSCAKCQGSGRIVTEESTRDTRIKGSLRRSS